MRIRLSSASQPVTPAAPRPGRAAVPRLDPVGRLRLPRRLTLLRSGLVALLLLTAAVVLDAGGGSGGSPAAGAPTVSPRAPTGVPAAEPSVAGPSVTVPPVVDAAAAEAPGTAAADSQPGAVAVTPDSAGHSRPGIEGATWHEDAGGATTGRPPVLPRGGDPDRLPIPVGLVAVPVPLADPASLAMLRPGDRIDLLSLTAQLAPTPVVTDVLVLAVDDAAAALLLALPRDQSEAVLARLTTDRFGVIVRT